MAAALRVPGLKPSAKLVLVGIANHDGDGGAWPSVATLSAYAGVTTRQVQKLISELVAAGLVTVEANAGGSASTPADRRPNLYRLHLDGVSPSSPRPPRGVSSGTQRGVAQDADGVSSSSPEPSSEPSPTVQEQPTASQPAEFQVANELARGYWEWVRSTTGHAPAGIGFVALRGVIMPFLPAGWSPAAIKVALAAMFRAGRPLTRQSLEAELRRRGGRPAADEDRGSGSGVVAV